MSKSQEQKEYVKSQKISLDARKTFGSGVFWSDGEVSAYLREQMLSNYVQVEGGKEAVTTEKNALYRPAVTVDTPNWREGESLLANSGLFKGPEFPVLEAGIETEGHPRASCV